MDAAIYKALSGMMVQVHRLDVTAQDLSNANTGGYKGQRLAFSEVLANRLPADDRPGGWVAIGAQRTNFGPGILQGTGNPFHLAIEGDGYFVIQTANGERYTRNGSFTMKSDGTLITPEGNAILGEAGPLRLRGQNIEVGIDGKVRSDNNEIGKLRIARFIDNAKVSKVGVNRFSSDAENVTAAEDARMYQGFLEQSNVSPIECMMVMVSVQRQFESYQRAIKLMDSVTEKMIGDSAR
jgi:flagellar basal-body rod protein FlgF